MSFCGVGFAQENPVLHLDVGETYVLTSSMENKTITNAMGQEIVALINSTSTYQLEVKEKTDSVYHLTSTLTHMKMSASNMGQEMTYDSDSADSGNPIGAGFAPYINKPQGVRITTSGRILKDTNAVEESDVTSAIQQMENSGYGAKIAFEPLPAKLDVGDTWTLNNSGQEGITRHTMYSVTAIEGNTATISYTGTMKSDITMERQGMEISTNTEGKFTGEERVNTKTGMVISSTTNVKTTGTVNAMGNEFPVDADIKITTQVKEM